MCGEHNQQKNSQASGPSVQTEVDNFRFRKQEIFHLRLAKKPERCRKSAKNLKGIHAETHGTWTQYVPNRMSAEFFR